MTHSAAVTIIRQRLAWIVLTFSVAAGCGRASEVPLVPRGGVYTVPVRINEVLTVHFVVDSGASEVQIPAEVAQALLRRGALHERDFIADRIYTLANGSQVRSQRILIRRLQIGDRIVEGVTAAVGEVRSAPLIGQSLLYRFPTWSLDNRRHLLILGHETPPSTSSAVPPPAPGQPPVESPGPPRPPGAKSRDSRDKKLLRLLCGQTDAKKLLDCSETP